MNFRMLQRQQRGLVVLPKLVSLKKQRQRRLLSPRQMLITWGFVTERSRRESRDRPGPSLTLPGSLTATHCLLSSRHLSLLLSLIHAHLTGPGDVYSITLSN